MCQIPGFCIELCCFLHPLTWPLVFLLCFFVLLLVRAFSSWHTKCHHAWIPIAGSDPTSWCFLVVLFLLCLLVFVVVLLFSCFCLFAFVVCFVFLVFLLGLHTGLRTGPLPVLLWLSTNWQPCTIITIHLLLRSNVCNDLAEAMKALDGKKIGNRPRGDSEKPRRSTKRNIGPCKI